jgi:alkanesulfonate monooxygenase SsuD/methylene tetrahydromethanopterin reductase-like flavin-dependent oxidoreductase (luciferase family)
VRGFDADAVTAKAFNAYREFAREFSYEAEPEKITLSKPIYLADTDRDAIKYGTPHFEYTFRQLLMGPREFWFPPGFVPPAVYPAAVAARDKSETGSIEEFDRSGRVAMGSPETVTERLLQAHGKMNYGVLIVVLGFGKMIREETKRNMELFAEFVLPHLRAAE